MEDRVSDGLGIGAEAGVPESEFFDVEAFEISGALFVSRAIFGEAVLATVKFDGELGLFAEEIECVWADWMLAAEFVLAEAAVSEPSPD